MGNINMGTIIVGVLFTLIIISAAMKVYRNLKNKGCNCSGSSSCSSKNKCPK